MKIKITADSTCDLSKEIVRKYDITITPLTVTMGDYSRKDGIGTDTEDLFSFVEKTGTLPHTSAVSIGDYLDVFSKYTSEGYDIVHISLGSGFSSAYQNACIAAAETGKVFVVDSMNLSSGQGHVVMRAIECREKGMDAESIYNECLAVVPNVEASFIIDRVDYLYKGGRCSALAAFGANLMKLKPCICVKDGKMEPGKKYRGSFEKCIMSYVRDTLEGREDIDSSRFFITHSKCPEGLGGKVAALIREIVPDAGDIIETDAGATVSTHCGPNTLGVLFIRK